MGAVDSPRPRALLRGSLPVSQQANGPADKKKKLISNHTTDDRL
jgi:hypothetical protein